MLSYKKNIASQYNIIDVTANHFCNDLDFIDSDTADFDIHPALKGIPLPTSMGT